MRCGDSNFSCIAELKKTSRQKSSRMIALALGRYEEAEIKIT